MISYQFAFLRPRWFSPPALGETNGRPPDLQLWLRGYSWIIKMSCFIFFFFSFHADVLFCFEKALMMRRSQPRPRSRNIFLLHSCGKKNNNNSTKPTAFLFYRTSTGSWFAALCFLGMMGPTPDLSQGSRAWRGYSEKEKEKKKTCEAGIKKKKSVSYLMFGKALKDVLAVIHHKMT